MNLKLQKLSKMSMAFLMALFSVSLWAQTPYLMSSGDKTWDLSGTWTINGNTYTGTDANNWQSVGVFGTGNEVTSGTRTTKSSATITTTTSGGLQKPSGTIQFLSTGSSATPEAVAIDLLLNFTGRKAETLSFDWAAIDNSNGTRPTSLRVFWSTNGTTFTELSAAQLLDKVSNNTGSITSITLPPEFNNTSTARIRFYNHAGTTATGSGNRDKFQIDNISVTSSVLPPTWNGTQWVGGTPSASTDATIAGNYSGAGFTAQSITVNPTFTLTVNTGETVTTGNTTNNGNIIVNDGGNFIQTVGSTYTSGTGASFVANRNSASVANKYVFWSSPVVSQNIFTAYTAVLAGTAPQYVMTYNTASNFYDLVANADANFTNNAGRGYSVKVPQANAALSFGGTDKIPNNGPVNVALAGTLGGLNNYNLIGNPYPSNLDLNAFYTANNTAIESTLWFWDNTTGNVTTQTGSTAVNVGYATVNLANPAGTTWVEAPGTQTYNSGSLNAIGNIAKAGQGFIVKALDAGTVSFTNAMRSSAAGVTVNKNGSDTGKFWIKLTTSYGNTVTQAITYSQGAADAYDVYDSKAMGMGSDAFYSLAGAEKLVIQGRAPFNINDVVSLGTKHFENGNFTVSLSHKEGLFTNGQAVYLHDKSTGTYTNLQNQAYSFTANAGEFGNRFEIVYKLDVLATSEVQKDAFEVYKDGEDFFVRNSKNIENIEIFDAVGRKVQNIDSNSKLVRIKLESKGLYIIKAKSAGKEYSKKVVK